VKKYIYEEVELESSSTHLMMAGTFKRKIRGMKRLSLCKTMNSAFDERPLPLPQNKYVEVMMYRRLKK